MRRSVVCSTLLAALLAFFLSPLLGCGSSGSNNGGNPQSGTFSVKAIQPAAGSTCVDPSSKIQITFSASANPQTVNTNNIQITDPSKNVVTGTIAYDGSTNTATFAPSSALASNVMYTVTVNGVASASGTVMASPFTASFTTGPCMSQAQYNVSLFNSVQENAIHGAISIDGNGVVTAQLTGATPTTTYALAFCPAPSQMYPCFAVGNVMTDGSGSAKTTIQFPQSGSWAGDFQLTLNGTAQYQTDVVPGQTSGVYMATLQPASTANGKGIFQNGSPGPQDPLTSGTLTVSNATNVQVQLTGASPNSTYSTAECPTNFGSSCYALYNSQNQSGFTTDANGNVTYSVLQDQVPGDIFTVAQASGHAGFVAGFKVP